MKSALRRGWRDSASLIVLNKRCSDLSLNCERAVVNYDVLLQTRPSTGSFPNSVVFPGGVSEEADASERWLGLLKSYGFNDSDFSTLHKSGIPTTPIFQPNPIERHVALRITAIRETFEELGLLLCSREPKFNRSNLFGSVINDVDVDLWQKRVTKDPSDFLNLCKEYECYPDIWSLYYWSNWLSPVYLPRRFSTAFFVSALERQPKVKANKEVVKVQWCSPAEILQQNIETKLELFPPQNYELLRLSHFADLDELTQFARRRSPHCHELIYPIIVRAKDGILWVYPGDDLYPSQVDYNTDEIICPNKTVLELTEESKVLHRLQLIDKSTKKWLLVVKNYKPNNHLDMDNREVQMFTEIKV